MSEILSILLAVLALAGVGSAAWIFSLDTTPKREPETPYHHAMNALLAGDREEAMRAFTETVRIDSDNVEAYIHLANLLREQGRLDRALHILALVDASADDRQLAPEQAEQIHLTGHGVDRDHAAHRLSLHCRGDGG